MKGLGVSECSNLSIDKVITYDHRASGDASEYRVEFIPMNQQYYTMSSTTEDSQLY